MNVDLGTTNLLLGIMAVVSLVEALAIIGGAAFGYLAYRRVMDVVNGLEQRQLDPMVTRVTAILDDVRTVTSRVNQETERVDHAIRGTIERVDETADRVRSDVRLRANRALGIVRGIRVAIEAFLRGDDGRRHGPSEAPGRI